MFKNFKENLESRRFKKLQPQQKLHRLKLDSEYHFYSESDILQRESFWTFTQQNSERLEGTSFLNIIGEIDLNHLIKSFGSVRVVREGKMGVALGKVPIFLIPIEKLPLNHKDLSEEELIIWSQQQTRSILLSLKGYNFLKDPKVLEHFPQLKMLGWTDLGNKIQMDKLEYSVQKYFQLKNQELTKTLLPEERTILESKIQTQQINVEYEMMPIKEQVDRIIYDIELELSLLSLGVDQKLYGQYSMKTLEHWQSRGVEVNNPERYNSLFATVKRISELAQGYPELLGRGDKLQKAIINKMLREIDQEVLPLELDNSDVPHLLPKAKEFYNRLAREVTKEIVLLQKKRGELLKLVRNSEGLKIRSAKHAEEILERNKTGTEFRTPLFNQLIRLAAQYEISRFLIEPTKENGEREETLYTSIQREIRNILKEKEKLVKEDLVIEQKVLTTVKALREVYK